MGASTTLGNSARRLEAPNYIFPGSPIAKFQHEGVLHDRQSIATNFSVHKENRKQMSQAQPKKSRGRHKPGGTFTKIHAT